MKNKLEERLVKEHIMDSENTMKAVVSSSVGKVLIRLASLYNDFDLEHAEDEYYSSIIEQISLSIQTLVTSFDMSKEKEKDYLLALEYLEKRVKEKESALDCFSIFDPNLNDVKIYTAPLKVVLILIWRALNDSEKYKHHYEGDDHQKIEQAEKNKKYRLHSFFECIYDLSKNRICHHGHRNDLTLLLNKSYENVDIIINAFMTINDHVKNQLFNKFINLSTIEKNNLKPAFFDWILNNQPQSLIKQLYSNFEKDIFAELNSLFLQHGTNAENHPEIKKHYDSILSYLEFSFDIKKYPDIHLLNSILQENSISKELYSERALIKIKSEIQKNYLFDGLLNSDHYENFNRLYQAYNTLSANRVLLSICGKLQKFDSFVEACELQFKQYIDENSSFRCDEYCSENLQELHREISNLKIEKFVIEISNFFSQWYLAKATKNKITLSSLYILLLNKHFQQKIYLLDDEIKQTWSSISDEDNIRDITPYQINRIFLHAIINAPQTWSKEFKQIFQNVVEFVLRNFNEDSGQLAKILKRDSYPPELLSQLEYLGKCSLNQASTRPLSMIMMPDQFKTVDEWINIVDNLNRSDKHILDISAIYRIKIIKVLSQDLNYDNIAKRLYNLPLIYWKYLLQKKISGNVILTFDKLINIFSDLISHNILIDSFSEEFSVIKSSSDLYLFLNLLSIEDSDLFIKKNLVLIRSILAFGGDIADFLSKFSNERKAVLVTQLADIIIDVIQNADQFVQLLLFLQVCDQIKVINILSSESIPNLKFDDLSRILNSINKEEVKFLFLLKTELLFKIKNAEFFEILFQSTPLLQKLLVKKRNEITSNVELIECAFHLKMMLDIEDPDILINELNYRICKIITHGGELSYILLKLNVKTQENLLNILNQSVVNIIQTDEQLHNVIKVLHPPNRQILMKNYPEVLHHLNIESDFNTLQSIMCLISKEHHDRVIEKWGDKLESIILSYHQLIFLLENSTSKVFISKLGDQAFKVVRNQEQLDFISTLLPENIFKEIYCEKFNIWIRNLSKQFINLQVTQNNKNHFEILKMKLDGMVNNPFLLEKLSCSLVQKDRVAFNEMIAEIKKQSMHSLHSFSFFGRNKRATALQAIGTVSEYSPYIGLKFSF